MADEANNQYNSETPKQSFQGSASHQITAAGVFIFFLIINNRLVAVINIRWQKNLNN